MRDGQMDDHQAIESDTAERYILGELNPEERDIFEEHFFGCVECAMSVRDMAKITAAVRLGEPHGAALPRSRMHWGWAAAASLLVVGLAHEASKVLPQKPTEPGTAVARLSAETIVLDSPSRGPGDERVFKVRNDEAVPFTTAIPAKDPHPFYICEIQDSSGRVPASLKVTRAEANDPVSLVVAPGILTSGNYKLVIRGGDREIAAYPFTVEVR